MYEENRNKLVRVIERTRMDGDPSIAAAALVLELTGGDEEKAALAARAAGDSPEQEAVDNAIEYVCSLYVDKEDRPDMHESNAKHRQYCSDRIFASAAAVYGVMKALNVDIGNE